MVKKVMDLNAVGRGALLKEQASTVNDDKQNKLIRGIPLRHLEAIAELKKEGVYRLSANDFILDAIADKLVQMGK